MAFERKSLIVNGFEKPSWHADTIHTRCSESCFSEKSKIQFKNFDLLIGRWLEELVMDLKAVTANMNFKEIKLNKCVVLFVSLSSVWQSN